MSDDLVGEACKILTTWKHCKAEAQRLRVCRKKAKSNEGMFTGMNKSNECRREVSSFKTCSREKLESVISDLTAVASKFCPNECRAFERCKAEKMSDEACAKEDLRALECGARRVIAAAAAR